MPEVGRRYSRRNEVADGLIAYDADVWHLFHGCTERYKVWAARFLSEKGIDVEDIVQKSIDDGNLNHGAYLREHVLTLEGIEIDSTISLAAQIYELSCLVDIFQVNPELFRKGEGFQYIFKLGRLSMLAKVYGIDDDLIESRKQKAIAANQRYTSDDKKKWREIRNERFSNHSIRRAAELIVKSQGLPREAFETVRKALTQNG